MTNLIKTIGTCAITLLFATSFTSFSTTFEAGKHYRVVAEKKTSTPELTEYFSYY
ncbi:hypothetical protein [Colwellia sp. PAMC 21821]|uniref:hypothetical protein n=1 Tax=Colwellia sp. PAMC 21821 TaxID=1816219 RepID=UPI0012DE9EF5|nr:hypothetical protein [Colwellia sp. PAMC 21821]